MNEEERLAQEIARLHRELESVRASGSKEPPEDPPQGLVAAPEPEPERREPTPEEVAMVDALLREAQLAKIRGQRDAFEAKLAEASAIAPDDSGVHEAMGDAHADARRMIAAKESYQRAVKANPKNVSAEKKLAELVFRELQAGLMASGYFANQSEAMTSPTKAKVFNAILPGFGHVLLGETTRGAIIIGLWVLMVVLSFALGGVSSLLGAVGIDRNATVQPVGYVPLVLGLVVYLASFVGLGGGGGSRRSGPSRPEPPVNLRF